MDDEARLGLGKEKMGHIILLAEATHGKEAH
jgi:hypothetical protein